MATKNATQAPQAAPGSNRTPSPADIYMEWLNRVLDALRKAFHSDRRLVEDATCRIRAKSIRAALEAAAPADRCNILLSAALSRKASPVELADAQELADRRSKVRDHLATMCGRADGEDWDALYYRVYGDRRRLDGLGRELYRLGAMTGPLPAYDPYRKPERGRAMDAEPSDAEDGFAMGRRA